MGERDKPHNYRYSPQSQGRTTLSSSWELATTMKMAVESMEMAPGAIPCPGRMPEQRLLSPKTRLQWWWRYGTFRGWILIDLGFSCQRQYIGGRERSVNTQGAHTIARCGQRWTRAMAWCGRLPTLLRLPFGLRLRVRKIETLAFVSSNSENISFGKNLE
jgi:hypothetical protein